MSAYALQKVIREINRNAQTRRAFFDSPADVVGGFELSGAEREALIKRDYAALYRLGVHGLLLRPFSILHEVSEPDYLRAIRGEV